MSDAPSLETATAAALKRLAARHPRMIDLGLERMQAVLEKLGHPERAVPPIIHVAGTNGKGSTVAFLRACLEAAGHRVHVYTSPHLIRFNERIRLAGKLIEDAQLTALIEEVEAAAGDMPLSFFEATTAVAFLAFSRVPADALILEVGLGGRLDATNVIEQPALSVITPVSFDHQQYLGDSLAEIAAEKAAIARAGVPLVTRQKHAEAANTIERLAKAAAAPLFVGGKDWSAEGSGKKLLYSDARGGLTLPNPGMTGEFQIHNAGLAVAALRHQDVWEVGEAAFKAGMGWAEWHGRLQRLSRGPLKRLLPAGGVLWVDGGHNADAAQALARHFKAQLPAERPFHLVVGMLANRDVKAFLRPFAGLAAGILAVPIEGHDGHKPAALAAKAGELEINSRIAADVPKALEMIADTPARVAPVVLVTGSIYLVGDALARNGTEIS